MHFYAASSLLAAVTDLLQRLVRPALFPRRAEAERIHPGHYKSRAGASSAAHMSRDISSTSSRWDRILTYLAPTLWAIIPYPGPQVKR